MTLKHKNNSARATTEIRRILVPTDFSEHSNIALKCAVSFARKFKAQILLLHVIEKQYFYPDVHYPKMIMPEQIKLAAEKNMCRVYEQGALRKPLPRQIMVREGVPYQTICETAAVQRVDLIIIATHGRTGLAHILLGSTAERVVQHAPCLVLMVRAA